MPYRGIAVGNGRFFCKVIIRRRTRTEYGRALTAAERSMDSRVTIKITYADGSPFTTVNPFSIAAEIRRTIGEVHAAKPADGGLLVTALDCAQAETLLRLEQFMGGPATASIEDQHNSAEAYAYAPALLNVSKQQLLTELASQGVIAIKRLRPQADGAKNPGLRIRLRGLNLPKTLKIGFDSIKLRRWIDPPLLCRNCAGYGHSAAHCHSEKSQCLQCAGDHRTDACKSSARRCAHCDGPHPAWNRSCASLRNWTSSQQETTPLKTRALEVSSHSSATQTEHTPGRVSAATQTDGSAADQHTQTEEPADNEEDYSSDSTQPRGRTRGAEPPRTGAAGFSPLKTRRQRLDTEGRPDRPATPPPVPPRPGSRPPTEEHEELRDPELFPKAGSNQTPAQHYNFRYSDGTAPRKPVTHLYRYGTSVLVADLDLSARAKAGRAARRGFYFDDIQGRRLFLK